MGCCGVFVSVDLDVDDKVIWFASSELEIYGTFYGSNDRLQRAQNPLQLIWCRFLKLSLGYLGSRYLLWSSQRQFGS